MDFTKIKELTIPEGRVVSVSIDGKVVWKVNNAEIEQLNAPTIGIDGSILTINSDDSRANGFAILVNGVQMTIVEVGRLIPTEGLAYNLSADGTYYTCTGLGTATATNIVIASEIDGIPVTTIGRLVFFLSGAGHPFTSIVIPKSVTLMKEACFYNCKKLTDIYYTGTVAEFKSITKERIWAMLVPATHVTCTDGTVEITEEEKGNS